MVGDAHRRLAPRTKHRTEDEVVGGGDPAIGSDRIMQVHGVAFAVLSRRRNKRRRAGIYSVPDPTVNLWAIRRARHHNRRWSQPAACRTAGEPATAEAAPAPPSD